MGYNYQDSKMESQQEYFGVHTDNKETLQNALKRILELEAQIEKMKCCGNCKHRYFIGDELECHLLDNGINCDNEDKWEIKEK